MLVLTDSTSGVQPVLEILSSWLADDPFSTVGFLTTSRRLVQRMETHLDALPEPRPAWTRDLAQIPVVVRQTVEEMITASSAVRVKYLVLLVSKPEQYIPQIFHASHIVLGDNAAALISRRAFAAGVLTAGGLKASCETTGVFSFLRSVTIEKIGHKTAERLKVQLNQLTKS
jgi:histidinol dehydrogenase